MLIDVIVTYSDKYIIGNNNDLPWNYEEDLLNFNKITSHLADINKKNILVYGYNSYKNVKLDRRIQIVITSKMIQDDIENDIYYVDSMGKCMEVSRKMVDNGDVEKIFICGGETIYKYFFTSYYYKFLDKIYITRVGKSYEGNKSFYGLEEKFYYIHTETSKTTPDLEFRVLQHDADMINPEMIYMEYLQQLLQINSEEEELTFEFELDIDLNRYFPVFSLIKKDINNILSKLFSQLKTDYVKDKINMLIDKINNNMYDDLSLDLIDIKPFESKYMFKVARMQLYSLVKHERGNIFNEVLFNIVFSSLLVVLIAKVTGLTPSILNYDCNNAFFLQDQQYIINKVAWNTPDVLPLIFIKSSEQKAIEDFNLSDISFGGLII
jgi:dihydrofolate reductase